MIFITLCYGEDRRSDVMHLLNDLRNLDYKVYLMTNLDFDLNKFEFDNVILFKTDNQMWNDFEKFNVIKQALLTENEEYFYFLDADTRFFNFRNEKFDKDKFEKLISTYDFDIMCSWFNDSIKTQLLPPDINENKKIRNFKFGFDFLIQYFKDKNPNYDMDIEKGSFLEGILIFKKSDKMLAYIDEMLNIFNILSEEERKFGREQLGVASGFAMSLMSSVYNINVVKNQVVYHFFKPNFLRELFPFNFRINKEEKIFN
jgi:hypothetical protein